MYNPKTVPSFPYSCNLLSFIYMFAMCWQEMVHALREELTLKENALEEMKKAVKEVSHL